MSPPDPQDQLSALIDGTLPDEQARRLRAQIAEDPKLLKKYEQLNLLREQLRLSLPPPEVSEQEWDAIALRIVSRGSLGLGWTLLGPGAMALFVGTVVAFFLDQGIPLWERLCVGAVMAGLTFLLMAAIADRLRAMRSERYDRVNR